MWHLKTFEFKKSCRMNRASGSVWFFSRNKKVKIKSQMRDLQDILERINIEHLVKNVNYYNVIWSKSSTRIRRAQLSRFERQTEIIQLATVFFLHWHSMTSQQPRACHSNWKKKKTRGCSSSCEALQSIDEAQHGLLGKKGGGKQKEADEEKNLDFNASPP